MTTSTRVRPRPHGFDTDLVYALTHPGSPRPYTILEELVFDDGFLRFVVPQGYRYDRASVPWGLRWVVPPETIEYAAAPHDKAYEDAYDKRVADALFHMIARADKANWLQARLALRAVQVGGIPTWVRYKLRRA